MTATIEAPVEPQAPEVAELSEETRKALVELREGGMILAELKTRFPQLTSDQIREALPAGNVRERKAKAAKTEVVKGVGGLAEALDTMQSAVWRAEQGRIHPAEVEGLKAELDAVEKRIASGEFVKAAAQPRSPSRRRPSGYTASRPPPSTCAPARRA